MADFFSELTGVKPSLETVKAALYKEVMKYCCIENEEGTVECEVCIGLFARGYASCTYTIEVGETLNIKLSDIFVTDEDGEEIKVA